MAAVKLAPASGKVSGTLNNIPLLVIPSAVTNVGTLTTAEANSVRFYADSAYVVELAREVVSADELHYKTGSSYSSSSESWMDWDGVRSDYAAGDTYGRNAVWSGYTVVYHLQSLTDDSSGNGETLTNNNTVGSASAKIKDGANFTSSNSNKRLSRASGWGINGGNITMSAWVYFYSIQAFTFPIQQFNTTNDVGYSFKVEGGIKFVRNRFGVAENQTTAQSISAAQWYHMTLTYDGSTVRGYLDAGTPQTVASSGNGSWGAATGSVIGCGFSGTNNTPNFFCFCLVDEMKITSSALSADWISTEYQNQNDNGAFWVATPVGGGFTPSPLIHQMMMAGGVV